MGLSSTIKRRGVDALHVFHDGPGKVFLQDLLITRATRGHHVRTFLTEPKAMTETAAAENEVRSRTTNLEARTLQNVPAKDAPDDDLEIPAANHLAMFAFERDELSAAGFVALANQHLVQTIADIGSGIALQGAQEIISADRVSPLRVRTARAVFIVHTAEIGSRSGSPEAVNVRSLSTARCPEVGVDRLPTVVANHLTFGGAHCGRDSSIERNRRVGIRHCSTNKPLAVRRRTKVIAVARMTSAVLHRVRANRNRERF